MDWSSPALWRQAYKYFVMCRWKKYDLHVQEGLEKEGKRTYPANYDLFWLTANLPLLLSLRVRVCICAASELRFAFGKNRREKHTFFPSGLTWVDRRKAAQKRLFVCLLSAKLAPNFRPVIFSLATSIGKTLGRSINRNPRHCLVCRTIKLAQSSFLFSLFLFSRPPMKVGFTSLWEMFWVNG